MVFKSTIYKTLWFHISYKIDVLSPFIKKLHLEFRFSLSQQEFHLLYRMGRHSLKPDVATGRREHACNQVNRPIE
jgi:hypothetical protein